MVDVFIRDEDVTFKDEDVTFDHHVLTLTVADAYSACTVGDVLLEYAFLVDHGIQLNAVAVLALVQEHNPAVSDTAHSCLPQGITLNLETEGDPDPVWFDTEAAIFKDHGDGVFYPHYLTILELADGAQVNVSESPLLYIESVLTVAPVYNKQVSDSVSLSEEIGTSFTISDAYSSNVTEDLSLIQIQNVVLDRSINEVVSPDEYSYEEKTSSDEWETVSFGTFLLGEWTGSYNSGAYRIVISTGIKPWSTQLYDSVKITFSTSDAVALLIVNKTGAFPYSYNGLITNQSGVDLSLSNNDGISELQITSIAQITVTNIEFGFYSKIDLGVEYVLAVSDGIQPNVTETVYLEIEGINDIAVVDAEQVQYADVFALFQEYVLGVTVTDSYVENIADVLSFGTVDALIVQNSYSGQVAESCLLSQQHNVSIADAVDVQLSDAMVLEQTYYLTTSDTYHEQVADSPLLNEEDEDVVTVENIAHSQFVDALVLIQEHIANSLDCAQLQTTETLDLFIHHAISVWNCENKNYAQSVTLGFKSGFLGVVVDPYLLSLTQHRAMESVTPHRYLMQ